MTPFFNNIFPPEVVTFVSRRPHDFSLSTIQNGLTEEQKEFLSQELESPVTKAVNIRQVHGNKVIFISKDVSRAFPNILEEADGILTDIVNLPIAIRTADCVPIFLYEKEKKCIGVFHAGWQGTQKRILQEGLKSAEVRPENVKLAFGPSIRECCYEIGSDVLDYFPNDAVKKGGKYRLDLTSINKKQAIDSGVLEENIVDSGVCTCCNKSYFSYRREGDGAGRNISLMMIRGGNKNKDQGA